VTLKQRRFLLRTALRGVRRAGRHGFDCCFSLSSSLIPFPAFHPPFFFLFSFLSPLLLASRRDTRKQLLLRRRPPRAAARRGRANAISDLLFFMSRVPHAYGTSTSYGASTSGIRSRRYARKRGCIAFRAALTARVVFPRARNRCALLPSRRKTIT